VNPGDYINSMIERSRRANDAENFETLERAELARMDDKALAAWQSEFTSDQPQWRLAEHEWQQRLTERQIAASHATARRAALWGACSGIAGALGGVLLAWVLSGQQPPSFYRGHQSPNGDEGHAGLQQWQQQSVGTPQEHASTTPAPAQEPQTPAQ